MKMPCLAHSSALLFAVVVVLLSGCNHVTTAEDGSSSYSSMPLAFGMSVQQQQRLVRSIARRRGRRRHGVVPCAFGNPSRSLLVCSLRSKEKGDDAPTTTIPQSNFKGTMQDFVLQVESSLHEESFVSLTLFGPKKKKRKKNSKSSSAEDTERLRGAIRLIQGRLIVLNSTKRKTKQQSETRMFQMTIKYHGATDVAKNWKVHEIKNALYALLLLEESSKSDSFASEWGIETLHPCGTPLGIQQGELVTTAGTWKWLVANDKLSFHKSEAPMVADGTSVHSHDRTKQTLLANTATFWQTLGIANADGSPRSKMSSKRRQCQKFVEIVSSLVESCLNNDEGDRLAATTVSGDNSSARSYGDEAIIDTISTVDMGCGRGYLTFALHAYLYDTYRSDFSIETRGIDVRPKLVKEINDIAESLGKDFAGLRFDQGTIEDSVLSSSSQSDGKDSVTACFNRDPSKLSLLIALHACDTASDDALWSGIRNRSDIIVVAPCCHKQIRRQLDVHVAKTDSSRKEHPYADVLRHNIYRERMAETVTDSIRALLLEIADYNVQVFEFIGGEHTSKNVMITAVKRRRPRSPTELDELRNRLHDLLALHGVHEQRLVQWMGELRVHDQVNGRKRRLSSRSMPPLK